MMRRNILTVAAAAALVLAPTAAFASYGATDFSDKGTVSDTTPAVGTGFTVSVKGPANESVTLTITSNPASLPDSSITIAGTKSLAKVTNAAGSATFTVTLSAAGSYTIVATDTASGAVLSTQSVSVAAAAGAAAAALPSTGSNALPIGLAAGALVLVGAGAVVVAKRRTATV